MCDQAQILELDVVERGDPLRSPCPVPAWLNRAQIVGMREERGYEGVD